MASENMSSFPLGIGAFAQQCGVSAHTIRFYEKAGILKPAFRLPNGHRSYTGLDVQWMAFVLRLKKTGMPLSQIKRYAVLREQGDATNQERMAMLKLHRAQLQTTMQELAMCADALDDKIAIYRRALRQMDGVKHGDNRTGKRRGGGRAL